MRIAWIRAVSLGAFAVASVISAIVVDDVELVTVGAAVVVAGALVTSGVVLLGAGLSKRRRPSMALIGTILPVALAIWAPLPIDWDGSCYGNGVTALWATPVAGPIYDATGIAGAAYDSRVEACV